MKNFFEIMKKQAQEAQPDADINQWIANEKHGFTVEQDRKDHHYGPDPSKTNYGRVTLYFNPHDQVISATPVQGIGWRGMNKSEIEATTKGVEGVFCQRVFAQGFPVGEKPENNYAKYDFWNDHHIKDENNKPLPRGDKRFWYPESPPAQYSVRKGWDANKSFVPKILTVATAPIFSLFFRLTNIPINGLPPHKKDGWVTPLQAPKLPSPFLPRSMRFGVASENFDERIDAPGTSRNAKRARDADDPYAGERTLKADPLHPDAPLETDKAMGNADTEKGLLYEHHAYLRMRAKRDGLKPGTDENGNPVSREDDLANAGDDYKAWRNEKIKLILAETVNSSATDHSTILTNPEHSEKALAYDIPVGVCHIADKDLARLRRMADWRFLDNLDEDNSIAEFVEYFEGGTMAGKTVDKWVAAHEHAIIPDKIIDKRSII